MAKRGPKTFSPDWDQVYGMMTIQCTGEEIASVLGISYDTLQRACKRELKVKFADLFKQKRIGGRASLRRRQWKDNSTAMLIFLGKQYLGQTDKKDLTTDGEKINDSVNFYLPSNGRDDN